jgi:2-oxoglutarate dehydrogenase E2 component (dihydrolipoamide succinyltransferase)
MNMVNITVPSPGESITTVVVATWLVSDGDFVERDQEVAEIDSDKATLSISAPASGEIRILIQAGDQAKVGATMATVITASGQTPKAEPTVEPSVEPIVQQPVQTPGSLTESVILPLTPLARAFMEKEGISEATLLEGLKYNRLRKSDVERIMASGADHVEGGVEASVEALRAEERETMSPLRKKLSQRLVSVKNETAMLTTFNEVDMSELRSLREIYSHRFEAKHGVKLGMMAFFAMAATRALLEFPKVNAFIDGDEIVYHGYTDISIAVSAPKGLVVPVVRNTHTLSIAGIEQEIRRLAAKARDNKLTLDEMSGGTFTITNGGVFGSMLSTPIINPPQSAILGMHNIVDRPVAFNGRVEIRPIMYVALSYDHRIIDGRESVGFLKRIKELIESPHLLAAERDPFLELLGL